jgi:hypothetical protein
MTSTNEIDDRKMLSPDWETCSISEKAVCEIRGDFNKYQMAA